MVIMISNVLIIGVGRKTLLYNVYSVIFPKCQVVKLRARETLNFLGGNEWKLGYTFQIVLNIWVT